MLHRNSLRYRLAAAAVTLFHLGITAAESPVNGVAPGDAPAQSVTTRVPVAAALPRMVDMVWSDAARQRDIPVRLYWPAESGSARPVPLVVFSHGLGGSRAGYSYLGQHWASLGFASLHVQHAGSDRAVWGGGNIFNLIGNLQSAASERQAIDRAKDVSFAITSILASKDYGPQIDPGAIAVAGHSYGANTAMLVGGATVARNGQPMSFRDDRVKALILISAPPFIGEGDMHTILGPIRVPTLHITGTDDIIRVPGHYSDMHDRIAVFDALAGSNKVLTVFKGASHSIFTDRTMPSGPELNAVVKRATRELSGLFLKTVLTGASGGALDVWMQQQAALIERHAGGVAGLVSPRQ
jgi:predicted dienelactone hydrolase